jgi:hypothetical protein
MRHHVYVCTPAYDGKVESNYSQSLAETAYTCPLYNVEITAAVHGNGAFIDLARNIFVKNLLTKPELKDCTHLFFVDADLKFEARAFIGLVKSGHPVCAGVYRRRQEPEEYPFRPTENPDGGGLWFVNDWLQCNRVPTGFLCIKRELLEEMSAEAPKVFIHGQGLVPWVFHTEFEADAAEVADIKEKYGLTDEFLRDYGKWLPLNGSKFIGEDYGFCNDYVRKYGKNVNVWTNFDFIHGGFTGNFFKWLTVEKDKHEAATTSTAA